MNLSLFGNSIEVSSEGTGILFRVCIKHVRNLKYCRWH